MYHVVVCSNCRYVWIAKDRPKTSQCGRCRKTRKFKLLKKYHKTDDKEEAKFARAFYQSRVNGQEDHFDRALEKGVLEEDMDAFLTENQYLEEQGMDADKVEKAVESILSPNEARSETRIIRDSFRELDDPDMEDFLEYTREYDVSDENAVIKLEGLLRNGVIDDSGEIELVEVEERISEFLDVESDREEESVFERSETGSSSTRDLIQAAVERYGDESVDAVLEFVEERGVDAQKAVIVLEKLVLSGQIDPEIGLQEISDKRATLLGSSRSEEEDNEESDEDETKDSVDDGGSSLSQREIMENAIEEQDYPTEENVIEYAEKRGIQRQKAERFLKKMQHNGEVSEKPDQTLRLI